ncbi:hypothetical protein [Bermanella sp. R86510]|uniref:hypothetical protein n=1 Tax=unclassified Bermanella TaxID=2627862 RepID=UPI0037C85386
MRKNLIDFSRCYVCLDEEKKLKNYYGFAMCSDCIKTEEETDWDQYEEDKRQQIAEENEH